MAKFTTRRFLGNAVRIVGRHPSDYAQELQEFTERVVENVTGAIPAGFNDLLPHPIVANAGNAGTESSGWAAADHEHDGRHTLLSLFHTDTTPASPTNGAVIRGNGTTWGISPVITAFDDVIPGGHNFLRVTGTLPSVLTTETRGVQFLITTAGSSAQFIKTVHVEALAGYTGPNLVVALEAWNLVAGTANTWNFGQGNVSVYGNTNANTVGTDIGVVGQASNTVGDMIGVLGFGGTPGIGAHQTGVIGLGGITNVRQTGGFFSLSGAIAPVVPYAALACNSDVAGSGAPLFLAQEAGATRFTLDGRGRVLAAGTAPTPTVTGFGGAGLVVAADTGSNDTCGTITVTAGAAPATTGTLVLTFANTGFGTNTVSPHATPMDGTGAWNAQVSVRITAKSTSAVTFAWDNSGAALVAGNTYKFAYVVVSH